MNAVIHSDISSKRWGAPAENFLEIHNFIDSSKEIESSNLHRAATHHLAFVRNVMIPIFGHTIHTSNDRKVNLKDCIEQDHILCDFANRYLPSLGDYVQLCEDSASDKELVETFLNENSKFFDEYPQVKDNIMYPLWNTGKLKSLLLTLNSWYIGRILPLIFKDIKIEIKDYSISPAVFFNRCRYDDWLSNGQGKTVPPSFEKIEKNKKTTTQRLFKSAELPADDPIRNIVVDGVKSVVYDGSQVEKQREEFQKVLAESLGSQPFNDNSTMIMDGNLGGFGAIENFKR